MLFIDAFYFVTLNTLYMGYKYSYVCSVLVKFFLKLYLVKGDIHQNLFYVSLIKWFLIQELVLHGEAIY